MLSTLLVAFAFMLAITGLMAVGVVFGRKPISGSCGGMAALGMESECDVCGGDKSKCDSEDQPAAEALTETVLSYDATKK